MQPTSDSSRPLGGGHSLRGLLGVAHNLPVVARSGGTTASLATTVAHKCWRGNVVPSSGSAPTSSGFCAERFNRITSVNSVTIFRESEANHLINKNFFRFELR